MVVSHRGTAGRTAGAWSAPWLALVLLGCGTAPEPPVEPAAPPIDLAALPSAPTTPQPEEPALCAVLAGLVSSETEAFALFRAQLIGPGTWVGRSVPPGTEQCTIEGVAWPSARYRCAGPLLAAGQAQAQADYADLAAEIDRCLAKPTWFPHEWERGEPFEFPLGERLQPWTDKSTAPPSQVVLRVQRDLTSRAYQVKLDLEAVP